VMHCLGEDAAVTRTKICRKLPSTLSVQVYHLLPSGLKLEKTFNSFIGELIGATHII